MFTRIRHQIVCPWIRRPRRVAVAVALFAALATSSVFAQCRGGSGGSGGGGTGGAGGVAGSGGAGGMGMASLGTATGAFGLAGFGQTGRGQSGNGFFSVPSEQMFQPAFPHIVDDNRQYLAERRALRAAKVEQARQRLASRQERPSKHRVVAVNLSREKS
jgi:hypothetical protein